MCFFGRIVSYLQLGLIIDGSHTLSFTPYQYRPDRFPLDLPVGSWEKYCPLK